MGYRRIVTYTLESETGESLRGAGWKVVAESKGGSWNVPSRPRVDKHPTCPKIRWEPEDSEPFDKGVKRDLGILPNEVEATYRLLDYEPSGL